MNRSDLCSALSVESRIEADGRRVLESPLGVGLLVTALLVVPMFLVPSVPLWVALVSLLTLTPLVLLGTYAVYHLCWWASGAGDGGNESEVREADDESTFERKLDRLLATESLEERIARTEPEPLEESEPNWKTGSADRTDGRGAAALDPTPVDVLDHVSAPTNRLRSGATAGMPHTVHGRATRPARTGAVRS